MNKHPHAKKPWSRPAVYALSIQRDTFGGSLTGAEGLSKGSANVPKDPKPRG